MGLRLSALRLGRSGLLGCAPDDSGERASTICGFLCQCVLPILRFDSYDKEWPDRHGCYPFAAISTYPPRSGQPGLALVSMSSGIDFP